MNIASVPEALLEEAYLLSDQFDEIYSEAYSGARHAGLDDGNARQWANGKARAAFPDIGEAEALIRQEQDYQALANKLAYDATNPDFNPVFDNDIPY